MVSVDVKHHRYSQSRLVEQVRHVGHQLVELSVLQQELLVLLPGQGYPPHLRLNAGDGLVALLDGGQGPHVHHNQHHSGHKEQEQPFLPPSSHRHHHLPAAGSPLPELRGQQKVGKKVLGVL